LVITNKERQIDFEWGGRKLRIVLSAPRKWEKPSHWEVARLCFGSAVSRFNALKCGRTGKFLLKNAWLLVQSVL
jgi:hypothetical protein